MQNYCKLVAASHFKNDVWKYVRIFFLDKLFHWIDQASGNDLFVYKTERIVASKVKV